jgi:hypothetical protein
MYSHDFTRQFENEHVTTANILTYKGSQNQQAICCIQYKSPQAHYIQNDRNKVQTTMQTHNSNTVCAELLNYNNNNKMGREISIISMEA